MSLVGYLLLVMAGFLVVVGRNLAVHRRFAVDTSKLGSLRSDDLRTDLAPVRALFSGKSQIERAANAVVSDLADAYDRGLLQEHDVDKSTKRVRNAAVEVSSLARAMAGIVIISGLLVTLFYLRTSVGHLQNVFDSMKRAAAQNTPATSTVAPLESTEEADALQSAMAGIAASAASAFGISAAFISFACGLLLGASSWMSWSRRGILRFEEAVRRLFFMVVPAKQDESNLLKDLSRAVDNLQDLSQTFAKTNTTLLQIGGFGDRFESAAKEISDAVAKLPAGMRESVSDMSGKLARDIAAEMEHYIEHIKHIEAIYGDQQMLITAIVSAMSNMEEDWRRSSEALVELRALPISMTELKTTIDGFLSTTTLLNVSVASLKTKVEELPVADLASAAREMRELTSGLAPLVSAVQNVSNRMKQLIADTVEASQGDAMQRLLESLSKVESKLVEALDRGVQELADEQKTALASLSAIANSIKLEVQRFGGGRNLAELAGQLEVLVSEIARVPKLPKFLSKSAFSRPA